MPLPDFPLAPRTAPAAAGSPGLRATIKGLIDHQGTPRGDDPPPLRITRAGFQAIGVETEDDAPEGATPADTGAPSGARGGRRPGSADRSARRLPGQA